MVSRQVQNLNNVSADTEFNGLADKAKTLIYVTGNTTDTAGTWTATNSDVKEYFDGLTILYKITVAGASATTLNINGLGAVTVVCNNNTAISTKFAVNSVLRLTYTTDGTTAYWKTQYYDTNDTTKCRQTLQTGNANRPILLAYSNNTTTTGNVDNVTYRNNSIFANPSTGLVTAPKFQATNTGADAITGNLTGNVVGNVTGNCSGTAGSVAWDNVSDKPTFATVATSGSYNDLSDTPTIPTVNNGTLSIQGNGTTASSFTANQSGNTTLNIKGANGTTVTKSANNEITVSSATLATVATSGSYNDLSNKPTIPTVNNGTLAIQGNGTTASSFTANQSGNTTLNIKGSGTTSVTKSADNEITVSSADQYTGTVTTTGTMTSSHVVVSNGGTVIKDSGFTIGKSVPSDAVFTDTTYTSKSASSGGTDVSLVTTGEKYTWNNKANTASPAFTGTPTAPTATAGTNTTQIATTAFVMSAFQANDAMIFKGTIGTGGTVTSLPATHYQGWTYKVITAGTYAGQTCEIGDMIICITDGTSATDAHWTVVQSNIDGAVTGPASSVDAHVAVFNGASGKEIKDSGFTIGKSVPSNAVFTDNDTKNTAGTTNKTGTKMFIVGATEQSANPTTYSNSNCYVGTDNCLYSGGTKVLTAHQDISGKQDKIGAGTKGQFLMASGTAGTVGMYTLETTGSGNAVTAVAVDTTNSKITVTKGATYSNNAGTVTTTGTMTSGNVVLSNGTTVIKDSGFTIGKSVPSNAVFTDTDVRNTAGSTENANKLFLIGATEQGANPQTYSSSKVYETDGNLVATKIDATQNGGMKSTFTLKATGVKTILQMHDASTYWTTNNGCAYIKALIHYSTVAQGTATATGTKMGTWLIEATYSGTQHSIYATEINANAGNATGVVRYFYSHAPKSTSYAPNIAIALYDATTTVYITPTILSATEGWEIPSTIGGDPGTTNYNRYTAEMGRYNYNWSSLKGAMNITGGCDGTAGWSNGAWDSLDNDRYYYGEAGVAGSLMGMGSDGYMWKLTTSGKKFQMPLHMGRCTGTFATGANYGRIRWHTRAIAWSELTNTTMQTTAFTVPTLTTSDYGKIVYLRGSLDGGYFKPDGNILIGSMANGYTNVPIGKMDYTNTGISVVPTTWTIESEFANAYTLDSNGKLTHVNGIEVKDTTYSLATVATSGSYNDLTNKPTIPTVNNATLAIQGNGTTASSFTANASSNVTLNIKGSGATTVTKSANNEITISSTDNNTTYSAGTGLALSGTTFNHSATIGTDTTSTASPAHSGTFTCVDSVTRDTTGHVTQINTKTVTLPASGNTDTKVKQTAQSSTTTTYPLLFSAQTSPTSGTAYEAKYSTNCYVKSNQLYSNGSVVLTSHQSVTDNNPTLAWGTKSKVATIGSTEINVTMPANPNTDTKNTAGTTASTGTKLYLVGASEQSANPQTYSNVNCYVGTDNCLYSGGTKVLTAHQSLADYVTKTGSESISNKTITSSTYNGYTLGGACAKAVGSVASGNTGLVTGGDVYTAVSAKQAQHTTATVTIATTDWSSNTCTKSATGVTASNTVIVSPAPASFTNYATAGIYCSAQGAGTLTFTCSKTPTASITVNVVILN